MRLIAAAFAVALLSVPAFAGDAPKKLTLSECINLRAALRALDSYQGVDKDGKSSPQQYKLGALRGPIALDALALDTVIKAGDEARVALVTELLPKGVPNEHSKEYTDFVANNPDYKKFIAEYQIMLAAPQSIDIPHIKLSDLKIGDAPDGNPIPTDVITALAPILDR
jgi:hypothetical protein